MAISVPDPYQTGNPLLQQLVDQLMGQMPVVKATQKCPTCFAFTEPGAEATAHVARHTKATANASLLKVLAPGIDVSVY